MPTNDDVLEIVKSKGPMLPIQIVKELGGTATTNTFFVGAMLSELTVSKKVKISSVKVGGSPLYYAPGQEPKLQDYSKYLHQKEQMVFDNLKQNKILRDKNLNPVERVAIRNMKDFTRALEVILKEKEIFWKWYLLPNSEAEVIIKDMLKKEKGMNSENSAYQESRQESQQETTQASTETSTPNPLEYIPANQSINNSVPETKNEPIEEKKELLEQEIEEESKPEPREENKQTSKEDEFKDFDSNVDDKKEHQTNLDYKSTDDPFLAKLNTFFEDNNIRIVEKTVVKKNSEIEFILKIPSAVGRLNYFCSAKNKKKCSDSDLSMAYVKAQQKNYPALFLCPGEMSKKGHEALDKELKSVAFKKL
jgi:hypothetical protein